MPDAFITLVSIQPSVSVQQETGNEAKSRGGKSMKHGVYAERRKNAVDSTTSKPPQG